MEMLSGSTIDEFLAATSLVWASFVVLIMIGLVFFIKFKERNNSIKNNKFFTLYVLTLTLNIFELYLNIVMKNNPSYEVIIYKIYVFLGMVWSIAIVFYTISYLNVGSFIKSKPMSIIRYSLVAVAAILCIVLNISSYRENSGKFYVLTGVLNSVYNVFNMVSSIVIVLIALIYRKKLPRGFFALCIYTFVVYLSIILFKNTSGYMVKESVVIYTLFLIIIFNTTSNQDKELVTKLSANRDNLLKINYKRNKLNNKIYCQFEQYINDLVLYNEDLYLTKERNKQIIQNDSIEIKNTTNEIKNFLYDSRDIYMYEVNELPLKMQYQIKTLTDYIYSVILPITRTRNIRFDILLNDNNNLTYIGDINKIGKMLVNTLLFIISKINNGSSITLAIASNKGHAKNIELNFAIKHNDRMANIDFSNLTLNDFAESNYRYNNNELKMIISNRLLEILNSKIDITSDEMNTIYSIKILQGLK